MLQRHYKKKVSGFNEWEQKNHAEEYLIYPQNIGEYISIDEVSLSKGELYTYLTNKKGRGKKGTLIASISGTKSQDIIDVILKIPLEKRQLVKEITLDMASNMNLVAKIFFPNANIVTDRFHVVKLVTQALQHIRIEYRWEEIKKENQAIKEAKDKGEKYKPFTFENGDSPKQLLARSRYIITKLPTDWTKNQRARAKLLFESYPKIEEAYKHCMEFRAIYETTSKIIAKEKIEQWIGKTKSLNFTHFNIASNSIKNHLDTIISFFNNRNTNANAESFNSKIKLFRANLRGVTDIKFFLFRLEKLFA
uniref:ISAon1 family transposase n=1 Tax=Flavobacterium davisii TaxID=2906077 RepID=UPI0040589808